MSDLLKWFLAVLVVALGAFLLGRWSSSDLTETEESASPTAVASFSLTPLPLYSRLPLPTASTKETTHTYQIDLVAGGVTPSALTVSPNDVVIFTNRVETQFWPSASVDGSCPWLDARRGLRMGESYSFRVPASGRCTYRDVLYPSDTSRQGSVNIQ